MATEHGPVIPLEQRCIRPGHWLIEGHDVKLTGGRHGSWTVTFAGVPLAQVLYLDDAREWIRGRLA